MFTATGIFKIKKPAAAKLVVEINFASFTIGLIGGLSLFYPIQLALTGPAGGVFLLLADLRHVANQRHTRDEALAMATDLMAALVVSTGLGISQLMPASV